MPSYVTFVIHEKGTCTPAKKVSTREAKQNADKVCDEVLRPVPSVNGSASIYEGNQLVQGVQFPRKTKIPSLCHAKE